jgi:hypothetical protein
MLQSTVAPSFSKIIYAKLGIKIKNRSPLFLFKGVLIHLYHKPHGFVKQIVVDIFSA